MEIGLGDRVRHAEYGKGWVAGWTSLFGAHFVYFVEFNGVRKQCEAPELTVIDKGYYQREMAKIYEILRRKENRSLHHQRLGEP